MALITDLILIAIFGLAVWTGYRRGIVKTVVKFVLLLLSVLLAKGLSGVLADTLADALPMPGIGTKLASYLNINLEKLENTSLTEVLTNWGFSAEAADSIERFVDSTASGASDSITRQVTPAIDRLLTEIILFVFLMIVFWLVTILLTTLINNVFDLPILSTVNHALGLGFGVLLGALSVLIIVFIMVWSFPLIDASMDINLTRQICGESFIIRFLREINPFMGLLG
ncbi:MAG: CvpA family protein [Clostridia bacterium]|nr:CvpA family protein [Clostridia bacterium]